MSAPFLPVPFETATAELPPRFASALERFTSWLEPNASLAGRFSRDIVAYVVRFDLSESSVVSSIDGALVNFLEEIYAKLPTVNPQVPQLTLTLLHHTRQPHTLIARRRIQIQYSHCKLGLIQVRDLPVEHGFNKGGPPGRGVSASYDGHFEHVLTNGRVWK
jgi:hypothetical protein